MTENTNKYPFDNDAHDSSDSGQSSSGDRVAHGYPDGHGARGGDREEDRVGHWDRDRDTVPGARSAGAGTDRPMRVGTVVWGLVIVALAALLVVVQQAGLRLDPGQVVIWLLLGAGAAMVLGGAASAARRRTDRN
ncbi:MAG: hypothetical protein JWO93_2184 [Micrococcaceae bacterium]|nr:hypothetical protein [Micrococcaceae bacterium]